MSEKINSTKEKEVNSRKIEGLDLDSVSGGAEIVSTESTENFAKNFVENANNQKCNCNKFQPHTPGLTLDVCENCKNARKTGKDSNKAYCVVQPIIIS